MRWRVLLLSVVLVLVSLAHYLTPTKINTYHAFYRWFYHLPIILAAFWFGFRGGVTTGLVATALYLPHVLVQWHGGHAEQWFEIVLYNLVGWVTGFLSQRQKDSYAALMERTRILLETEEQLRRADRLSALGELSAGLAHEIKTPLASIRGAAEILSSKGASDQDREEFSGILLRETDRLNRVVNRFLDFARPKDTGTPEADLNEAAGEILDLVRLEAERGKVEFRVSLGDALPPVGVDPVQLRQVVLNLVMNALQAMEAGGQIFLTTAREDGGVRLRIGDTGEGIPAEALERVFDPFFTTRAKGTGLGLSIVHKILSNHGAELSIRAREGGGTEVMVRLPAAEVADGS